MNAPELVSTVSRERRRDSDFTTVDVANAVGPAELHGERFPGAVARQQRLALERRRFARLHAADVVARQDRR